MASLEQFLSLLDHCIALLKKLRIHLGPRGRHFMGMLVEWLEVAFLQDII